MGIIQNIRVLFNPARRGRRKAGFAVPIYQRGGGFRDFAKSEILECEKKISDAVGNAEFSSDRDFIALKEGWRFVHTNRLHIIRRLFAEGIVIIDTRRMWIVDDRARIEKCSDLLNIDLAPWETAVISETMRATGKPDIWFLLDKLRLLNVINNSDLSLIENYGAMGIITPAVDNSVSGGLLTESDIADLQERYRESYGTTDDKWSILFAPQPLDYKSITLPISQLNLTDKRLYCLKAIYSYFGIPSELAPYFDNATYANRNEAVLDFYATTVRKWADVLLEICRKVYETRRLRETYLLKAEQWYDFKGVLALEEAKKTERESAIAEYDFWRKIETEQPEFAQTAKERIHDIVENL